jgi:dipeptide/tripeptide permease
VGLFYVAVAAGALVGSALAGSSPGVGPGSLYRVAVAAGLCGVAIATFGVASWIGLALVALVVAGFATDFHEVIALTFFQNQLPDRVYGRFFSFFLTSLNAGGLVGALMGPVLATAAGVQTAMALLAVPGFAFALALAGAVRRQALPDKNAGR